MKIEHLALIFAPRRVVYVPASGSEPAWDTATAANLGGSGYRGELFSLAPAKPRAGLPGTVVSLDTLPDAIDLAVVSLPQPEGPALVDALAAKGCKALLLIGAAATGGDAGRAARHAIRDAAKHREMRVLGPDRLGVMVPSLGFNAGSWPRLPAAGPLALVTQSDSIAATLVDWAAPRRIGFSRIVSLGETADAEMGDLIDFLAMDRETRAILLHVQEFTDARRFLSAARMASRSKPVVVVRGGRWAERGGQGSTLAGRLIRSSDAYHAAFKRAGIVRVGSLEGLFAAAETLSLASGQSLRSLRAGRLAIIANGSGPAILAADALIAAGGQLAVLPVELRPISDEHRGGWVGVADLGAEAGPDAYREALDRLAASAEVDAVLAVRCPTSASDPIATANTVIEAAERLGKSHRLPVLTAWLGEREAEEARTRFVMRGVPTYSTPEQAVEAFMVRVRHERNQAMLIEIPKSFPEDHAPDRDRAARIVQAAEQAGQQQLAGPDALDFAESYGLAPAPMRRVSARKDVATAARELGFPVVLTIRSGHANEGAGGMLVSVMAATEAGLRQRLAGIRVGRARPERGDDGGRYVVQWAGHEPGAAALFIGMASDPHFGPVIVFGHGGDQAAAIRDLGFALPPLNASLARQLIAETRVGRLLLATSEGGVNIAERIVRALCDFSLLVVQQTSVVEAELNPVWVGESGVRVAGATFRFGDPATRRLAVQPYPSELEETLVLWDGRELALRPIRPEDAPALQRAFAATDAEDRRMRLFTSLRELSNEMAARLTQVDYDRELALVAVDPTNPSELLGGARVIADPDNRTAEYAVSVRSEMKGTGLGPRVLARIIDLAEARGIRQVWGTVLRENKPMLAVCEKLGFRRERDPDDPEVVKVVIDLPRHRKPHADELQAAAQAASSAETSAGSTAASSAAARS
ncbi:MAG: GNAT family N-acetyltransferase [Burkholderiales bacterium]